MPCCLSSQYMFISQLTHILQSINSIFISANFYPCSNDWYLLFLIILIWNEEHICLTNDSLYVAEIIMYTAIQMFTLSGVYIVTKYYLSLVVVIRHAHLIEQYFKSTCNRQLCNLSLQTPKTQMPCILVYIYSTV